MCRSNFPDIILRGIITFIFSFSIQPIQAQVTQEWVVRYNGPGNYDDQASCIAVDISGNVYVAGNSYGIGTGYDYAAIKYNSSGTQLWVARYDGPLSGPDYLHSMVIDASGNVYITGSSETNGPRYGYATIKYNSSGVQQWVARLDSPGSYNDGANSIVVDPSANVYVTGSSAGDYATIKYNSSGVQQWVAVYNGPGNGIDIASSIAIDASGSVYVTGKSVGSGTDYDYATIKYSASNSQQWVSRYNGSGNGYDQATSLAVDMSGNVYVTGSTTDSTSSSDYDYTTIKYNSSGVQQWVESYKGAQHGYNVAQRVVVDGSGNVYVTGYSDGGPTLNDYATIKYNSSGVQLWVSRYSGPGNGSDYAYSLALDASGNVYVTGYSYGGGTGDDYATIKYNSSGIQQWVARYNGTGNGGDDASSLAVDANGNVYVTGGSTGIGSVLDFATIKYSQPVGIKQLSNEFPKAFNMYQNYPNPFNPRTRIRFELRPPLVPLLAKEGTLVSLIVYDILGCEIATLVNEQLKPGSYEVEWDGSKYASGIYIYRLETDNFIETKKMILLK